MGADRERGGIPTRGRLELSANLRRRLSADESRRTAILRVNFQPAVAGVDHTYFESWLDIADMLRELGGRGEHPGCVGNLVDSGLGYFCLCRFGWLRRLSLVFCALFSCFNRRRGSGGRFAWGRSNVSRVDCDWDSLLLGFRRCLRFRLRRMDHWLIRAAVPQTRG